MPSVQTVGEFINLVQASNNNPQALNYHEDGYWHSISTESFIEQVKYLTLGLVKMGLKPGNAVGILLPPSPIWTIANFAIIMAGGISVPLFANISEDNFAFEVKQTALRFLFVAGEEQWNKFYLHKNRIERAISIDKHAALKDGEIHLNEVIKLGKDLEREQPHLYDQLKVRQKPTDLANIIYTSGSTGIPKGVMLTQLNIMDMIDQNSFDLSATGDRFLSILPLAHIYGYTLNNVMIGWGVPVYYFNDLKNVGLACQEIHPTIVVLVPRLLEKIYAKMLGKVHHSGLLKRTIGQWAFDLALEPHHTLLHQLTHPLMDKLVYHTLREALGGSLRIVVTGGAALSPKLCRFFIEIGVPIFEGWGMTEATVITVNKPGFLKIGTVGRPLDRMKVKISDQGELLVKGPVVTSGYYKNSEATAAAFDEEGWLHTGDKGTIDQEGYITIIGRLKELYKTSTGEYIAPIPIEQALCQAPLIDMSMVIAEGKKFASCLLFPNFEVLDKLKLEHHQEHLSNEEFLETPQIRQEMQKLLGEVNTHLNHWEQLHAYSFITEPLTIEHGELTPSMKLRRDVIAKKYHHIINSMYHEVASV